MYVKNCGICGKLITDKEMQKSIMPGGVFGSLLGEKSKYMPNVMEGLAMKCNRCGVWICIDCAQKFALSQGAGMIQHSNCGGMFENP